MCAWFIQDIFKNRDTDKSGTMSSHEMRDAVTEAGQLYQTVQITLVNNQIISIFVLCFAAKLIIIYSLPKISNATSNRSAFSM